MTRREAEAIRAGMDSAGTHLTDEQADEAKAIYRPWKVGEGYTAGDMRQSAGKLWRCIQGHTSQTGWEPETTPALWVEVGIGYREIKDGMLPTEAFAFGEIGWWQTKDNLYRSLINANVYTPVSYPQGWEAVHE